MDNRTNANPSATSGENPEQANYLRQYWHIVLERRWLIIATFAVFVVAGVLYAYKATPLYESTVQLQIDPESAGVLSLKDANPYAPRDTDYLQTQYRNLESRTLLQSVFDALHLEEDERYRSEPDRIAALSRDIRIDPQRLTRLVAIKVRHPEATKAERIANKLVTLFLDRNQDLKKQRALFAYRMLNQEAGAKEAELEQTLKDLQQYRQSSGMVSLKDDQNVDAGNMKEAKGAYEIQRAKTDAANHTAEMAKKWKDDGRILADFPDMTRDVQVAKLKDDVNTLSSKLAELRTRYREKWPAVKETVAALEVNEAKLKSESERALQGLIEEARREAGREADALAKYKEAEKRVFQLGAAKVQYDVLEQKRTRAEFLYNQLLAKVKEFDLGSKDILQNMTVVDAAVAALKPVSPNKPLVLVASVIGGVGFAFLLAFFVNYLDDSVKSQEDVENYLHLPFLGYVPNIKSVSVVERDLQSHLHPTSSAAEGFRTLRAAVSLARNSEKLRVIAVTSTIPSEGKSLVASNYAIVTAQTGLRTLLVDADLRRPSVHKAFQLQSPIGLSAYLAERINDIGEIVRTTEVPNLDVVCCGAAPSNPSELISSKRMIQFLEEASSRYDRVVCDCPPVSAVADPLVVGAMADGVIFVTKFNKIRRQHALRSVQRITDAGIHLIGVVLNDIDFEGKDSYYYSYHYYQNRYYSSHYRSRGAKDGAAAATTPAGGTAKKGEDSAKSPVTKA
ncbi:MAG TPA: polysaccharide biosynthesis tyrosine autokinase [Candidatus Limnocylindria bacterium]|nr:polysaccharide biosynthesis tyrosine autokinase [Candidatus Limnocylindria bacterium]